MFISKAAIQVYNTINSNRNIIVNRLCQHQELVYTKHVDGVFGKLSDGPVRDPVLTIENTNPEDKYNRSFNIKLNGKLLSTSICKESPLHNISQATMLLNQAEFLCLKECVYSERKLKPQDVDHILAILETTYGAVKELGEVTIAIGHITLTLTENYYQFKYGTYLTEGDKKVHFIPSKSNFFYHVFIVLGYLLPEALGGKSWTMCDGEAIDKYIAILRSALWNVYPKKDFEALSYHPQEYLFKTRNFNSVDFKDKLGSFLQLVGKDVYLGMVAFKRNSLNCTIYKNHEVITVEHYDLSNATEVEVNKLVTRTIPELFKSIIDGVETDIVVD